MIADVIGLDRLNVAMSIDAGANQSSRVTGPALGGFLLATAGLVGCFALELTLCVFALIAAIKLKVHDKPHAAAPVKILAHILDGLRAAHRDRRLRAALIVTVVFNMFVWPCLSMIPVIGTDRLHLDASGVGLLASMEGLGAIMGSIAIGVWSRPAHSARLYLGGCILADFAMIGFSTASNPLLAGCALVAFGFCGAGFSIMQATLIYRLAPPELRGRILGLISVSIGVGPVGFLLLGLLADAIGAKHAVIASASAGLLVAALLYREWVALMRNSSPHHTTAQS